MRTREEEYDFLFMTALDIVRNSHGDDESSITRAIGSLIFEVATLQDHEAEHPEPIRMLVNRAIEVCEAWHTLTEGERDDGED